MEIKIGPINNLLDFYHEVQKQNPEVKIKNGQADYDGEKTEYIIFYDKIEDSCIASGETPEKAILEFIIKTRPNNQIELSI